MTTLNGPRAQSEDGKPAQISMSMSIIWRYSFRKTNDFVLKSLLTSNCYFWVKKCVTELWKISYRKTSAPYADFRSTKFCPGCWLKHESWESGKHIRCSQSFYLDVTWFKKFRTYIDINRSMIEKKKFYFFLAKLCCKQKDIILWKLFAAKLVWAAISWTKLYCTNF